ncbi:HAD family hydrolase [Alkalicoccus halolimnae]|uniref:HAD family hydrolase n=1 Tax=Alkalicoccus halolimnae TaxID=1667239 RepID=A0A5C7F126_9BACI|nr:HAD family hydrolase [Alkalicoccus halolimnae]TXF83245.1 HAD family hydrolase [Alkalicoccus halolimnae]
MKAVLFDFDGTLADTLPCIYHSFQEVFLKYDNKKLNDEEVRAMFGPPENEIIYKNLEHSEKEKAVEYFFQTYSENHERLVKENKEVTKMLHELSRHFSLGIITGKSRRGLEISLEILGMKHYFDVLIPGDEVKNIKPHPEGVQTALASLHAAPSEAIFAGDSDSDIETGIKAGVHSAGAQWLPNLQQTSFTVKPDAVFKHAEEFEVYCLRQTE